MRTYSRAGSQSWGVLLSEGCSEQALLRSGGCMCRGPEAGMSGRVPGAVGGCEKEKLWAAVP